MSINGFNKDCYIAKKDGTIVANPYKDVPKQKIKVFDYKKDKFNIAVIDGFTKKTIDLDGDYKGDITHLRGVQEYLKSGIEENVNIDSFDAEKKFDPSLKNKFKFKRYEYMGLHTKVCKIDDAKIYKQTQNILDSINSGKEYDFLNISLAADFKYEHIEGKEATPENLTKYKQTIKTTLKESHLPHSKISSSIIENFEKIAQKGTKVCIAAGNDPESFNTYTFANGTVSVGSLEKDGTKSQWASDNSEVDVYSQGTFEVNKVSNDCENGYDVTENGKVNIHLEEMPNQRDDYYTEVPYLKKNIKGTSFATPTYINKTIKQHLEQKEFLENFFTDIK